MNSEETAITLKLRIRYGYDAAETTQKKAQADAIGLAVNPDFTTVFHGTYLNCVTVMDDDDNVIAIF